MARPSRPPDAPGGAERKLVTVLLVDVDEVREGFAYVDPEDTGRLLAGPAGPVLSTRPTAGWSRSPWVGAPWPCSASPGPATTTPNGPCGPPFPSATP